MRSWLAILALCLSAVLQASSKAETPDDLEDNAEFTAEITNQLEHGQFDALEAQYLQFTDREHQIQEDGTPKSWIFFLSFERAAANAKSIPEAKAITEKIIDWLDRNPRSVPATLALENALLGEADCIHRLVQEQHRNINDPFLNQLIADRWTR
jgi:hypothetical protein